MSTVPKGPCSTCPYVCATPPGVWAPEEYERLRAYDLPTGDQPMATFGCHYDNGNLCGGWLATHDSRELLSIRLGVSMGHIPIEVFDYKTDVPCWSSGAEACEKGTVHGRPGPEAEEAIDKILFYKLRRGGKSHE